MEGNNSYHRPIYKSKLTPITICLSYTLFGSLWILFSDKLLYSLTTDAETLVSIGMVKGWIYVLLTAGILYFLIRRSISASERSERALHESEANFKALTENAFDGIFVHTRNGHNVYVNKKMVAITGYSVNELLKIDIIDIASPSEKEKLTAITKRRLKGEFIEQYETEIISKMGKIVPLEVVGARTTWHNEVASIIFLRDITDRKLAEEALKKRTIELNNRVKELRCLYTISDLVNKQGILLDDILQKTTEIIPPACQYPAITCVQITLKDKKYQTKSFNQTQWKLEHTLTIHGKQQGSIEVYYLEKRPYVDKEGPFQREEKNLINTIAEHLEKIIERRQIEDALRENERRLRDLIEESLTGILILQDNKIVYKNPELERLYGPQLQLSTHLDFSNIHPEDNEMVKRRYQEISSGAKKRIEMNFRLYPLHKINDAAYLQWVYCRAVITEYRGKEAILINMMDGTEVKKLEYLAGVQDKMISLGRVAAGIAHEIRNPLSGINIYLDTLKKLQKREGHPEKATHIVEKILSASKKIESVIRRVMDFSKPHEPKFNAININQPIEEAVNLCAVTLRKSGIKMTTSLAEDLPLCIADGHLIEQVMLNIITNAAEAMKMMEQGKKITITSQPRKNHVMITVSDSGPGVPQNIREKIFDPFYSTKQGSTGIGLSLCHRIVSDHHGSLKVLSNASGGADFKIMIPIKQGLKEK